MSSRFPPCPDSLRSIQPYLKLASEHDEKDPVISYWCRLYSLQTALKIDKQSGAAKTLLLALMDWLEKTKRAPSVSECISSEVAAQAYLENYALKLFVWADNMDRSGQFNKNVVKSFYASGILMDVIMVFGELTEDLVNSRKYAKWKAAYINNCLKNGDIPIAGPMNSDAKISSFTTSFANHSSEEEKELDALFNLGQNNSFSILNSNAESKKIDINPSVASNSNVIVSELSQVIDPNNADPVGRGTKIGASQIARAQKYCKFASSALNYDDVPEAVKNLQSALNLLQTGCED